jgi:hypothetical protein
VKAFFEKSDDDEAIMTNLIDGPPPILARPKEVPALRFDELWKFRDDDSSSSSEDFNTSTSRNTTE